MSVPLRVTSIEEEEESQQRINSVNGFNGEEEEELQFNPRSPPPFKFADIRAAIPKHY